MTKNTNRVPTNIRIILLLAGGLLQYALPQYQLLFLGIVIIVLLYEVIQLKRTGKSNYNIYVMISFVIFAILLGLVVCGKNYLNMSSINRLIILAIAFSELMITIIAFGYKAVNKSNDARSIRQFKIGVTIVVVSILLLGIVIIFS